MARRVSNNNCKCCAFTVLALCLAVAGGIFAPDPIHAQGVDKDYVDVAVVLEVPFSTAIKPGVAVVNNGTRTAYDVEVVVKLVSPTKSTLGLSTNPQMAPGSSVLRADNNRTIHWTIPELGGLQREELFLGVVYFTSMAPAFDNNVIVHEFLAEVTTSSFESELHEANNTSRVWSYKTDPGIDRFFQAGGNHTVAVSVDKLSPSPGDTVNFTVTASRTATRGYQPDEDFAPVTPPPIDLKVDIELTDGLSVSGTPSYDSANESGFAQTTPSSVSYSNGVFNIGTLKMADTTLDMAREAIENSVTLPVRVSSDAVVNRQCLTATLTGNPPPGTGPLDDDISDNVAKLCLWSPSVVEPVVSGQLDAFTVYPCVGITSSPCDSANDLRIRAVDADGRLWNKGTAVIWVNGDKGRIYNGHTNSSNVLQSVNNGNTVFMADGSRLLRRRFLR